MKHAQEHEFRLDKRVVRTGFERAAPRYDEHAVFQREIGDRLIEHLEPIRLSPGLIADVGAGTGGLTRILAKRFRGSRVIALDFAPAMLMEAKRKAPRLFRRQSFVCGDAEHLPLLSASVDIVLSNLALPWCDELDQVLEEFSRVLVPGGLLMFSTLGPETLKELRASWSAADSYSHVHGFMDMHDIGDALVRAGFSDVVVDVERLTMTYANVYALMKDLKALGHHNATIGRCRSLTGRGRWQTMETAYEEFRSDGSLPASYEVVYAHAWQAQGGGVEVAVDNLPGGALG